ncbi:MAG: hypothetical protein QXJ28_00860 [Candidatus Pacearchaeota archaeon]
MRLELKKPSKNIKKDVTKIRELFRNKYLYLSIMILLLGLIITFISGKIIAKKHNKLPVLSDILLDNLPHYNIAYMYDLFAMISLVILFGQIVRKSKYEEIPYVLTLLGFLNIIRGIFLVLTPFGNPTSSYSALISGWDFLDYGVYPSGHVGAAFLAFLLTIEKTRYYVLLSCFGVIISLLLAKGHYSIDIFSGIIFAYAIYSFGEKNLRNTIVGSS